MTLSLNKIAGVLAVVGALASKASATAPLSNNVHTETAPAQEIGSTTSDGFLVYSLNVCFVVQTTICETSVSTGAPAPSYGLPSSDASGSSLPYEGTDEPDYPVPTGDLTTEHPTHPSVTTDDDGGYTQTISGGEPTDTGIETAIPTDDDGGDNTSSASDGSTDGQPSGTSSTSPSQSTDADAPSGASVLNPISILVFVVGGTLFI